jgi:hypothetical protein
MLTFDEASHTYCWDGRRVPNVTSILAPLVDYSHIPPDALERARQQGIAVHRMVELDCKNDLDVAGLPDWMRGHHAAWRRFTEETAFCCIASEHKVYHEGMAYAGTLDLVGSMRNARNQDEPVLIDVKRSFFAGPVIGLQLAAYAEAWNKKHKEQRVERRFGLRLDADGKYRLEPFEDRNDFAVFTAMLTLHRWKEKHSGRT